MNKTKTIYFLSAIVLIVGCYALNLSYSLFVQTEEKEAVSSTVPNLSYSLNDTNTTKEVVSVLPNSNKIVSLKVNNKGTSNIKYRISAESLPTNVGVKLLNKYDSTIEGRLNSNNSKYVWVGISNNNSEEVKITFSLNAIYDTLNFNEVHNSNIDTSSTELSLKENIIIDSQYASVNNSKDTTKYSKLKVEELKEDSVNLLLSTDDDFGESFYYRGNVNNNYVNFNDMCFRIVRVLGNGNIKLVLEDASNVCENSNDSKVNTFMTDGLYKNIDYGNITDVNSVFKSISDENKEKMVLDATWCGGSKEKYDSNGNIVTEEYLNECQGTNTCDYKYRKNNISLVCDNHELITSSLGSLTYDEVYLAGNNKSNYLNNSVFDIPNLSGHKAGVDYRFSYDTDKIVDKENNTSYNYRPSIIIKDTVNFEGNGNKTEPYIIK